MTKYIYTYWFLLLYYNYNKRMEDIITIKNYRIS